MTTNPHPTAATGTKAPVEDTLISIDALSDLIRDQLRRIERVLRGALVELDQAGQGHHS